jgi:myb proto-oncogene protein
MNSEQRMLKYKRAKTDQIFSIKKIKNQKKWTREEDELLIALAEKYNEKHWKEISKRFVKKNSLQCFSRYKRIRPGIIKGSWKKEEDLRIMDLVNKYGKSWSKISKILGTRNGKQIRDRFINVLDPEIRKGKFTEEEDRKLIALYKQHGPKWATIAKYYTNRTADMIKNRFHSSIKKKLFMDDGSAFPMERYSDLKEYRNEDLIISKQDSEESYRTSIFILTL